MKVDIVMAHLHQPVNERTRTRYRHEGPVETYRYCIGRRKGVPTRHSLVDIRFTPVTRRDSRLYLVWFCFKYQKAVRIFDRFTFMLI